MIIAAVFLASAFAGGVGFLYFCSWRAERAAGRLHDRLMRETEIRFKEYRDLREWEREFDEM